MVPPTSRRILISELASSSLGSLSVTKTYVRMIEIKAPTPAILVPRALLVFRARHNRRSTVRLNNVCWWLRRRFVWSGSTVSCRFANSSATRNEKSSRKGVAAHCAMLDANELVNATLLPSMAVMKKESFRGLRGRFAFTSGGFCIVQIGSVTKRQSSVATRTNGKKTIEKARAIWKSFEMERVLGVCFSYSSALEVMLLETIIALQCRG
jgi:hypothetical protein